MSGATNLKVRLAAAAIAALALTGIFNEKASAQEVDPVTTSDTVLNTDNVSPALAPVSITLRNPISIGQNANDNTVSTSAMVVSGEALLKTVQDFDAYYTRDREPEEEYSDHLKDPKTAEALQKIMDLLEAGADPDYVDPQTGESAFAWGLWMAYEFDRPDVVEAFLKHGADPKQVFDIGVPVPQSERNFLKQNPLLSSGKKITIMDHAVWTLIESQNLYRSHIDTAVQIINMLEKTGLSLDDTMSLESQDVHGYKDLALHIVGMAAMRDGGLVSVKQFDEFLRNVEGSEEIDSLARSTSRLTPEFIKANGGKLLDYPDAFPGGPEPYEVKKGDTLWNIATRFRNAMGMATVQQALETVAAANDIDLDANNTASRAILAGETLLLPVPEEHQIGSIGVSVHTALVGIASRIMDDTGEQSLNAVIRNLIETNGIMFPDDKPVPGKQNVKLEDITKPGATISYTVKDSGGSTGTTVVQFEDTIRGLAAASTGTFYKQGASEEEIMQEIARLNGLDMDDLRSGAQQLKAGQLLHFTFLNDDYLHMQPLTPPATYDHSRRVNLVVIEPKTDHGKQTFRVAASTNFAINRDVDFTTFYRLEDYLLGAPHGTNKALSIMLNLDGSPLQDRIVFSHSMGRKMSLSDLDRNWQYSRSDNVGYEDMLIHLEELERNKPIIFDSAGNEHPDGGLYVPSTYIIHSPRTVIVGAAGMYPVPGFPAKIMVSPYSTYGAEICAALPTGMDRQREGTSFSTPLLAGVYKQFSEWYGDVLSFEEIMAVGMMTADRDVMDFDPEFGFGSVGDDGKVQLVPAEFRTNGAGLPYHGRCGAGVINESLWNDMLKKMVELKQGLSQPGAFSSVRVSFGDPVEIIPASNGQTGAEYIYHVKITEDMTLGRLTFMLAQNIDNHSDVTVKTPGGFEQQLPRAVEHVVSTSAFNYEDVKVGDVIEIRTTAPFADNAAMVLRGHASGNAVQLMRDYLHAQDILPAPLKIMSGNKVMDDENDVSVKQDKIIYQYPHAFSKFNLKPE